MNAPCYKCEKREPGCHSKCHAYREFRTKLDDINKKRLKALEFDSYMAETVIQRVDKSKR